MSKYDAERALAIYKTFSKQTNQVVEYLSIARRFESSTRLEIPKLKHAPTSLTSSLEEYLNDPDFEINRRQYLAQQDAKKGRKGTTSNGPANPPQTPTKHTPSKSLGSQAFPDPKPAQPARPDAKGPAPDLIDFFDSIEDKQQSMFAQPQQQVSNPQPVSQYTQQQPPQAQEPFGFAQQQQPDFFAQNGPPQQQTSSSFGNNNTNPFGPLPSQQPTQQNFTGMSYGSQGSQPFGQTQNGFTGLSNSNTGGFPQPAQPQQPQAFGSPQQPQSTNPFRTSVMPHSTGATNSSFPNFSNASTPLTHQSTNPFSRDVSTQPTGQSQSTPFGSPPPFSSPGPFNSPPPAFQQQQQPVTLQPTKTGTNPFARTASPPQPQPPIANPLVSNVTGSTNPFRQNHFVNQQTGQGWQASQGSLGGLEQLETVPVFPRPGQQNQPGHQPWP